MKKIIMTAAVFFLAGIMAYAGGSQPQAGKPQSPAGPVKLTVAITENLTIQDYETNYQTRMIEKLTNTDLDFVVYPTTDYLTKLNLMVLAGGGELQDILIAAPADSQVYQWAREKAILPLKKYYDNPGLSANIRGAVGRAGYDFIKEIVSPDGEIYGIPRLIQSQHNDFRGRLWYYKPWVDKLGVKIPTNTEEMRTFLRAMSSSDLNWNGRNDEIAMTGNFLTLINSGTAAGGTFGMWFSFLMNPFTYVGTQLINVDNGIISVPYNTEGWRSGLKYIRSLFAEGLIPLENLTQDYNQVRTLMNSNPARVGVFINQSMDIVSDDELAGQYDVAPPLRGTNGTQYATVTISTGTVAFMVSANCKNPEAAFRVGDAMLGEELCIINRYGERGVQWDYPKDIPDAASKFRQLIDKWPPVFAVYNDAAFFPGKEATNHSWKQNGPILLSDSLSLGRYIPRETSTRREDNRTKAINMYTREAYVPKEVVTKLIYSEDEMLVISDIQTTLNNYVLEMTSNFLAGNRYIDASWNAYIAELNTIGLPRLLSTLQKAYDRMYK